MPGLLPPRPDAAEESAPETAETDAAAEGTAAPAAEDASVGADAAAPGSEAAEEPAPAEAAAPEVAEEEEPDRGEPLFEVSDRRATILADRAGIVFRLDEEEADFTWDEIGAVEIDTPRFGKRFKVTVYTGPRRWFEAHVEAKSRSLLKTWTAQLDAVLDEHFEDPDAKAEPEPEPEQADEPEQTEAAEETAAAEDTEAEADTEQADAPADEAAEPEPEPEADADAEEADASADEAAEPEPEAKPASALKADKPDKPLKSAKPAKAPKPRGKRTA